ncbi:tyrosine recombinase xerD [Ehrlichia ruminantium]|uniref:tyrosine recombinase n=1 Tax=Ehrlichia ruminantium TaxID=779 RepID=UPI0007C1341E|nr:tyrosine recombinase [Ehrlichia ruminantium]QLK52043.1 tyrosine recombinase [Ehrlichia ruminantium]QLK53875.1 tyrosine recombinase [Ehrlichia ruminantium]QLK54791.1 tyrosine recombinase [Ehrlichia ruminantium]QLK55709.1 tyrosine recombinase [Ehrlichia ruminantium]QLK56626.1 tyrosine recombinase [Ehrlichia ruminantium]
MMSNEKYVNEFLTAIAAEKHISYNTYQSYMSDLLDLCKFFNCKNLALIEVSCDDLKDYVRLMHKREYKSSTISRKISAIKNLYKFFCKDNIIAYDPALSIDFPRLSRTLPKALNIEEVSRLLDTAALDSSPDGLRTNAIINILYSSGIRVSELIYLKLNSIKEALNNDNIEISYITIRGKANRERIVLLNSSAIISIQKYLEVYMHFVPNGYEISQWLFPGTKFDNPITRQRIGQLLKDLSISAGVDMTRISPHKLRHSFATHLLNNGSDIIFIQKMLGHTSLSTTQIYTYVANEKLKNVLFKYHPLRDRSI